jgi:hypothetical protein
MHGVKAQCRLTSLAAEDELDAIEVAQNGQRMRAKGETRPHQRKQGETRPHQRKQGTDMICVVATVMQLQLKFWAAKWITADKTFNLSRAACTV